MADWLDEELKRRMAKREAREAEASKKKAKPGETLSKMKFATPRRGLEAAKRRMAEARTPEEKRAARQEYETLLEAHGKR